MSNVVIKIGSAVISEANGKLNTEQLSQLVSQIAKQVHGGHQVTVVSSGAVSAGRSLLGDELSQIQSLAAIGQPELISEYAKLFAAAKLRCGQVLVTKSDFRDRTHYLNMRTGIESLHKSGIVPIVNENDVVSLVAIKFTDNDELAGLIAAMLNADILLILTSVDGLLANKRLVKSVKPGDKTWAKHVEAKQSKHGRGGMLTKASVAQRLANLGITTHIVNGTTSGAIEKVLAGEKIGTVFAPLKRSPAAKRWLSQGSGNEKATIKVNTGAAEVLSDPAKPVSLLPVGIIDIEGSFAKADVLKIVDEDGKFLGIGKAQYNSATAKKYQGQQHKKPLIHYDYLWIER